MGNCCANNDLGIEPIERLEGDKTQLGRYVWTVPFGFRTTIKRSVLNAEEERDGPVFYADVVRAYNQRHCAPISFGAIIGLVLVDLAANDELLVNWSMTRFSVQKKYQRSPSNPESDFMLYSDRVRSCFSNYVLDD